MSGRDISSLQSYITPKLGVLSYNAGPGEKREQMNGWRSRHELNEVVMKWRKLHNIIIARVKLMWTFDGERMIKYEI